MTLNHENNLGCESLVLRFASCDLTFAGFTITAVTSATTKAIKTLKGNAYF